MSRRDEPQTVAWQRWSEAGYSQGWSRTHMEDPENPGRTLCRRPIPDKPGVEVDFTGDWGTEGGCKRCLAVWTD